MPRLICLHGFLGRGADWDFLRATFPELEAPDLEPALSLEDWATEFCERTARVADRPVLMGYSMGARLAMRALVLRPELFSGAVLVSGNPGLRGAEERSKRLGDDELWARRFETEAWESVIEAWNAQPVLKRYRVSFGSADASFFRGEGARANAVRAMRTWSLGRQRDLLPELARVSLPVLWVAGERDSKYVAIAREAVSQLKSADLWIAPGAGHRVPWDAPDSFSEKLNSWISRRS